MHARPQRTGRLTDDNTADFYRRGETSRQLLPDMPQNA